MPGLKDVLHWVKNQKCRCTKDYDCGKDKTVQLLTDYSDRWEDARQSINAIPDTEEPLKAGLYLKSDGSILEVSIDQDSEEYKQKMREIHNTYIEAPATQAEAGRDVLKRLKFDNAIARAKEIIASGLSKRNRDEVLAVIDAMEEEIAATATPVLTERIEGLEELIAWIDLVLKQPSTKNPYYIQNMKRIRIALDAVLELSKESNDVQDK